MARLKITRISTLEFELNPSYYSEDATEEEMMAKEISDAEELSEYFEYTAGAVATEVVFGEIIPVVEEVSVVVEEVSMEVQHETKSPGTEC